MATSSISDCNRVSIWRNPCRQPLRPATTSPSFYPYKTLKSQVNEVPIAKNRNQLETLLPGREYFSLPSTPPRPNEMIGKYSNEVGERGWTIQSRNTMQKTAHKDENGNRFLPEWYIEPCTEVLNMPCLDEDKKPIIDPTPLDHPQKRDTYQQDSSFDEDCDFSDESQHVDLEDISFMNPSSGEVSKLNSLGQGQSRFLSLFNCQGNKTSRCSSTSNSDKFDDVAETSIASATEDVLSEGSLHDSEITDGIEAVRRGLARLLSIPAESLPPQQKTLDYLNSEENSTLTETPDKESCAGGSRLLKLFPTTALPYDEENFWHQDSPPCISSLWKSDSSLANGGNCFSSEASSMKNSPTIFPDEEQSSPVNLRVPNIASISPTAPLHFKATSNYQLGDGFPIQDESISNSTANSKFFTACDLSNEETEIEAALERGDGFFTNDDFHCDETPQVDDTIWSPSIAGGCSDVKEDALNLGNISPMTLKRIAEDAANDIIDWLDNWLSHCSNTSSHDRGLNDPEQMTSVEDENAKKSQEPNIQTLNFCRMFDNKVDDTALQRILNLAEEEMLSDAGCPDDSIFAHLAQSPGILDFLVENDKEEEKENLEYEQMQTQFSSPSLHLLLNSRTSDIYDSYLLFPDFVHFTNPMKNFSSSECKNLDESSIFSQLFSSSFDWMGNISVLDSAPQRNWDRTLQSLSPKTPFTPTGNLSENLHSFERKHSITLEHLCNLATVAASIESRGIDHTSFLSTDIFVQYLQSQLGCFENIAFFDSPSLKNDLIPDHQNDLYWNDECVRLYRPVPLFPLQFINRLSLTNSAAYEERKDQENLLFSPETHFRPITPGPDEKSESNTADDDYSQTDFTRPSKVESLPDDIDDELVAIHEGADHSKLVELYAQMQLKQQLAAEQKQNYPQLVTVEEDGSADDENAYEEKHLAHQRNNSVTDYALDCAAEAAATVAVNALGSADPAEALAILEDWHWKESSHEEGTLAKTFPDLGYFETAQTFLPSSDCAVTSDLDCRVHTTSVLENGSRSQTWSVDDGTSIDQSFEYDSIKKIWIRTLVSQSKDETDVDSSHFDLSFTPDTVSVYNPGSVPILCPNLLSCSSETSAVTSEYDSSASWGKKMLTQQDTVDPIHGPSEVFFSEQVHVDLRDDDDLNPPMPDHLLMNGIYNVHSDDQSLVKPG